jgi:ubiquinone/menaquinone biosynthesis C-methylase UbiE
VPDGSVEVVVSTLVFCSISDYAPLLKSIARILAPGGRFYFWDHVEAPRGTLHCFLQNLVSSLFFWPYFGCGCRVNRRPHEAIDGSGLFKEVVYEKFEVEGIPDDFLHKYIFSTLLKYHVCGIAVK